MHSARSRVLPLSRLVADLPSMRPPACPHAVGVYLHVCATACGRASSGSCALIRVLAAARGAAAAVLGGGWNALPPALPVTSQPTTHVPGLARRDRAAGLGGAPAGVRQPPRPAAAGGLQHPLRRLRPRHDGGLGGRGAAAWGGVWGPGGEWGRPAWTAAGRAAARARVGLGAPGGMQQRQLRRP